MTIIADHTAAAFRALIAEDEPILAAALGHALNKLWPQLNIVATCANGVEAVSQALALQPDVLFLDIKMPGKTGLEAAEELAHGWPPARPFPQLVFVTAYDEFAVAAFEQAAADYVLKPVNDARLGKTIERLKLRLQQAALPPDPADSAANASSSGNASGGGGGNANGTSSGNGNGTSSGNGNGGGGGNGGSAADRAPGEAAGGRVAHVTLPKPSLAHGVPDHLARLLAQLQHALPSLGAAAGQYGNASTGPAQPHATASLTLIRAAVGNQVRMIPIADVVYFEALDKYVNVITREGEALIRTSLKELLPQLDAAQFWQVHRGTIVNASCIASATRDEVGKLTLQLRGRNDQLRVSPLYAHLFRQM
jgi:DNA-binding LytR/AlgR family response regulator